MNWIDVVRDCFRGYPNSPINGSSTSSYVLMEQGSTSSRDSTRLSRGRVSADGNGEVQTVIPPIPPMIKAVSRISFDAEEIIDKIGSGHYDVYERDKYQNTTLHRAIENYDPGNEKHSQLINLLIEKTDMQLTNTNRETPLHWAARNNKWMLIDHMIKKGANVNSTNKDGNTALHLAVTKNHVESVELLYMHASSEKGAILKSNIKNNLKLSPLQIAECIDYETSPKIKTILNTEPDVYIQEMRRKADETTLSTSNPDNMSVTCLFSARNEPTFYTNVYGGSPIVGTVRVYNGPEGHTLAAIENSPMGPQIAAARHIPAITGVSCENHDQKISPQESRTLESKINSNASISGLNEIKEVEKFQLMDDSDYESKNTILPTQQEFEDEPNLIEDKMKARLPVEQTETFSTANTRSEYAPSSVVSSWEKSPVELSSGISQYPMNKNPRGLCLILSNTNFSMARKAGHTLEDRKGSSFDVNKLTDLFTWLKFQVDAYENLTAYKMFEQLKDMARVDHTEYDCFVCCILTHGCAKGLYGTDGKTIVMSQITDLYNGMNCSSLQNKPKLFFLQCCRGILTDDGYSRDGLSDISVADAQPFIPDRQMSARTTDPAEGDFFIGYPTPPGYTAWRRTFGASWYIDTLCDVFQRYAETEDLLSIMTEVNNEVAKKVTDENKRQIPEPKFTLRKKLFFHPQEPWRRRKFSQE